MAFSYHDQSKTKLAVGGNLTKLFSVDIESGKTNFSVRLSNFIVYHKVETTQGVCCIKQSGRYMCCGGTLGELTLRDPRTLKVEHKFDVHSGTVSDIDTKGDLLVTCGFSNRYKLYS